MKLQIGVMGSAGESSPTTRSHWRGAWVRGSRDVARSSSIARCPVHLDSPMASKVDAVFARHPNAYKALPARHAPFGCRNFSVHVTGDESKQLNRLTGRAIIIASSGMATGGRVLNHLHRHLTNPVATVIFPGYQVRGTLGRLTSKDVQLYLVHAEPSAADGLAVLVKARLGFGTTVTARGTTVNL